MQSHPLIKVVRTSLGALGAATLVACGAASPDSAPTNAVSVSEPIVIDASPQTKSELGVQAWGVSVDDHGTTWVRGYAASGKPTIEFHQSMAVPDDTHRVVEVGVAGAHGNATLQHNIERTPASSAKNNVTVKVVVNTFVDNADARRVLELLDADQRASAAHRASGGNGGALVQSIHASDIPLINGTCANLTPQCLAKITLTVGGVAAAAHGCSLTVVDTIIALICDVATAETGVGPLACTAAALPAIGASAAECAIGAATAVDSGDGIQGACVKKCGS